MDVIWAQMEFDHEKHHRTDILLISASEEVIETLEDNQVSDHDGEQVYKKHFVPRGPLLYQEDLHFTHTA